MELSIALEKYFNRRQICSIILLLRNHGLYDALNDLVLNYHSPTETTTEPYCCIFLTWIKYPSDKQKHINIESFIIDLTNLLPGLKSHKKLGLLFKPCATGYKITVPNEHLFAFLCIFHQMHCCKRICCNNSRGLFMLLRSHLKAAPGEQLPSRKDYAKLYNEMLKNIPQKEATFCKIKSLLEKYCCPQQISSIETAQ